MNRFELILKSGKIRNNIKNILNRNTVHNNIELKFVSFLKLQMLESKGSFSNLGQGNAKYLSVKIKDTLSTYDCLNYFAKINKT